MDCLKTSENDQHGLVRAYNSYVPAKCKHFVNLFCADSMLEALHGLEHNNMCLNIRCLSKCGIRSALYENDDYDTKIDRTSLYHTIFLISLLFHTIEVEESDEGLLC